MSDQLPRYPSRDDHGYRELLREAVGDYLCVDASAMDTESLVLAQRLVNGRHQAAWYRDATARACEHGWSGDMHEVLELLCRSDIPRLRLPD